jgi:EAL domain-containing protein (putative c-di-GMP-specific phosphodiesterase class I)
MTASTPPTTWFLQGFADKSHGVWRTPIEWLPFTIGRSHGCSLFLDSRWVSQRHCEIFAWRDELRIVDLDSSNGTFVNDRRLEAPHTLADGDVLRVADWEFRLVARDGLEQARTTMELATLPGSGTRDAEVERKFQEMVESQAVWSLFQPIVRLSDRAVVGFEALGRGLLGGVETLPLELFAIAESVGRATELAELFRRRQLSDAAALPGDPEVFLNTHPAELTSERPLIDSLAGLRARDSRPRLCIEIHEAAAPDLETLGGLQGELAAMNVGLAFDDFGTGQPRLLELAEISPRYLKFDRAWIRDLDRASERRRELVRTLVRMVEDLGITAVAEGVERCGEAEGCREVGFELAQGFHFGRPARAPS